MTESNHPGEVTALIERWMLLDQQGLTVSVEDLCREAPHLTDSVRKEIEALRQMDDLQQKVETDQSAVDLEKPTIVQSRLGQRTGNPQTVSQYRIQEMLGHGGCSEVYVAFDESLGRQVAVKFLRPDTQNIESYRDRLNREAEITSRLNHPGVVSIHAIGHDEQGLPFYVMRLIAGKSLSEAIAESHERSRQKRDFGLNQRQRQILQHFVSVCQTVAFCHQQGVIHRDIKPANIIVGEYGETYLIDWGLAKSLNETESSQDAAIENHSDQNLTRVGQSMGTPAFMSPEQAEGDRNVGIPSDVFSLGATLYTILVGKPPYVSDSAIENIKNAKLAKFKNPRSSHPEVAKPLEAICIKAMARKPEDRYTSAASIADDIENYLADQPISASPEPVYDRIRRWIRKNRTAVTALAAAVAVALLLMAIGNTILFNVNRRLAKSEADAVEYQRQTQEALDDTTRSLYSKKIALAHSDILDNNIVRAQATLESCHEDQKQWEWGLLNWMTHRYRPMQQLTIREQQVNSIALCNQRKLLAAGTAGGCVRIWDMETWKLQNEFFDRLVIQKMAFSPDGKFLVLVGSRGRSIVSLWNLETTKKIAERNRSTETMTDVEWTADGSAIVTCEKGGSIRIRNPNDLKPLAKSSRAHADHINSVALNPKSRTFFTGCADGTIGQWDMNCKRVSTTHTAAGSVLRMVVDGDRLISSSADNSVQLWKIRDVKEANSKDVLQLQLQQQLVGHRDQVLALTVSPDGKYLATGGLDRNIVMWDLESGEAISKIRFHTSHIRSLKFDATGQYLFSTGDDRKVNVWAVGLLTQPRPRGKYVSYCGPDDQLIVAGDREVLIWDSQKNEVVVRITDHPSRIIGLVSNQKDMFATLYRRGQVRVWNAHNGKLIREFDGTKLGAVYSAVFLGPNKIVTGHHKQAFMVSNIETGKVEQTIACRKTAYRMALADHSKKILVLGRNGKLSSWDTASFEMAGEFDTGHGEALSLSVQPTKNRFATAGYDGLIRIWDLNSNQLVRTLKAGNTWINGIAFTRDGQRILAGNEHTVTIWNAHDGQEVLSIAIDRCVHRFSFNKDGTKLALGGDVKEGVSLRSTAPLIRVFETFVRVTPNPTRE